MSYTAAATLLAGWQSDVLTGAPPLTFDCGLPIALEPGRITLLGGAPGAGKTALAMQATVDALRGADELFAMVANIEMPPAALLDRQLSRLADVPATSIMRRTMTLAERDRLPVGFAELQRVAPRLAFVRPPFDVASIAQAADDFAPGAPLLLVLDYVQRLAAAGEHRDRRAAIDSIMATARCWADAGAAVLIVSAVGRHRDSRGNSTYAGLALGSFRESSELEFGADAAYVLAADPQAGLPHRLAGVKSRYGETADYRLAFDGSRQRFRLVVESPPDAGPRPAAPPEVRALWGAS